MKKLDHPMLAYLIIAAISLACAVALFFIGGSIAEVTGNENTPIGLSFKAGGAIAGFIIIFWISQVVILKFYKNLQDSNTCINVKVHLTSKPNNFQRTDSTYVAEYIIFNGDSGESVSYSAKPFWEAGHLTVLTKDVGENDYLTIKIKNATNNVWESDSFHSRSPKVAELNQLN